VLLGAKFFKSGPERPNLATLSGDGSAFIKATKQWRTQKISEGEGKFRHNRVTSQINFRGSAEGTTILGGSGGMPPRKFCKVTPKNTHFCAFWK